MKVKKTSVKRAATVGIGIAIAIAIAAGVYAVSGPQDETPSGDISMKDEIDASIQPPEEEQIESTEKEEFGMKDEADVTINPPEEEPSVIKENVTEGVGMESGQGN